MRRVRETTPADYRRLDRLVWSPGGVYDTYTRSSWEASIPSFVLARHHSFRALGHTWTLTFTVSVWRPGLDATVSFTPERLLAPEETERLQAAGFFSDLAALFGQMGYEGLWVSPRSNGYCVRYLRSVAEIAPLQKRFETLDLTTPGRARGYRLYGPELRASINTLLRWGRKQDRRRWFLGCLELRATSREPGAGVRWKTRRDVVLGPLTGCSWLFAWPPGGFSRADWRRIDRSGFFKESARKLKRLGQQGRWRADLFHDPDRMAAEFWRPTKDPVASWHDFKALLDCRLS